MYPLYIVMEMTLNFCDLFPHNSKCQSNYEKNINQTPVDKCKTKYLNETQKCQDHQKQGKYEKLLQVRKTKEI